MIRVLLQAIPIKFKLGASGTVGHIEIKTSLAALPATSVPSKAKL